ncbi:hypothetical protein Tco_0303371, partial [Tanacetum coccineum]
DYKEPSDTGSPGVVVYGYDGLSMHPSDVEIPVEDQPYAVDASPTALSPGFIADSDLKDKSEDGPTDYPAVDHVPFVKETKPFETDESVNTPPSPVARLLALPTPPLSPLTLLSSPLPQIPSPPLPVPSPLTTSPTYAEAPLGYRAAEIRLRAASPLPLPSPPLPPPSSPLLQPSTDCRADIHEAVLPPRKRLCLALGPRFEVEESSSAAATRPTKGY